jgi:hypothetical protein
MTNHNSRETASPSLLKSFLTSNAPVVSESRTTPFKETSRTTASPSVLRSVLEELNEEDSRVNDEDKRVESEIHAHGDGGGRTTASPSSLFTLMDMFRKEDPTKEEDDGYKSSPHDLMEGRDDGRVCPDSGIPRKEMFFHVPRTPITRGRTPAKYNLTESKVS